ncbi:thioesterase family protein [Mycolicibacterium fluoranthenivorans]|uniref:Thioesterase family protein n=1 Tax=Mycolicibacterium fluoranthenivorans TaxID=258505 RepID=A0A7G8PG49_9MYCO|nr:acyl-CoA thioesterase domain-containing protein [Mycolicibacterium fluoranthenivorans]QNJ93315.1 thioesterase family protein [Mycolicibacterium fluoranthenivorans]
MVDTVRELLDLLTLRCDGPDTYIGSADQMPAGALFGGHVVGQALVAASQTVSDQRLPHSVHCLFVAPGRSERPIDYRVARVGDGGSFSRRRVVATQVGRELLTMQASFHIGETGLTHDREQPLAPDPDSCTPLTGLAADPERWPDMYGQWGAIDVRVAPRPPVLPRPTSTGKTPGAQVWLRVSAELVGPQVMHSAVLACVSDMTLLGAALAPHGISHRHPGYRVASLDHCLWIHAPFRADEWMLYHQISPVAAAGRGFCRGEIYQAGRHIATVVQEGLIRTDKSVSDGRNATHVVEAATANHRYS